MMYFKVKIGYGDNDFISIDETELNKAIRCQIKGTVALFGEGTVAGNHIISITPDYNRLMGYNPCYKLKPEDYNMISKRKVNQHKNLIAEIRDEVYLQLQDNGVKQIE